MSIKSVINDTASSESIINAQKPLPPTITNYSVGGVDDTALDPAGGQTVLINGTGFLRGATITFDGNAVSVVNFVNATQLSFTSPAKSAGTYTIYVVNPDGGTAIYLPGIIYSLLPTWTTSAGSLGSYYETTNISNTVVASGDAPITYSLYSGSLPSGSTLYANGTISGTAPVNSGSTTYSFTIQATDAQLQDSTRSFSLTINTDVVTWVNPANGTTYTNSVNTAISNVVLSATDAAGYNVTYSANALPTGLTLSGANISGTPTVIADSSTLLTATAATTNRSATTTINWSITVAGDPYFKYVSLLLNGDNTPAPFTNDASLTDSLITIAGDTRPNSFNPYQNGYYSNYFAANEQLTSPTIGTSIGTSDFSMECWVNVPNAANGYAAAIQLNVSTGYNLYIQTHFNTLRVLDYNNPSGSNFVLTGGTINSNTWYHLLLTRQSGTIRGFINGNLTVNQTGVTFNYGTAGTCLINAGLYAGTISNARVVLGNVPAAYQTSSTTNGTQVFTPSTTPLTAVTGTVLLTSQSNRFIDNSPNAFTLTLTGAPTISSSQPFGTPTTVNVPSYYSNKFNGSTDYISVPDSTVFTMGAGNFTIECWVNLNSISGSQMLIGTCDSAGSTSSMSFVLNVSSGTPRVGVGYLGVVYYATAASAISTNTWTHIAGVRNGASVYVYVNGVQSTALNMSTFAITDSSQVVAIGRNGAYNGEYTNGQISNVRIVKGVAVYTGAFTPPTSPLQATQSSGTNISAITGTQTSLLTCQNSTFIDNSTNAFTVTTAGSVVPVASVPFTQTYTQQTVTTYGSGYFDGTGDYLTAPNNAAFNLNPASTAFTVELWFYAIGSGSATLISKGESNWRIDLNGSTGSQISWEVNGTTVLSAGSYTLNVWNHVAVVNDGTSSSTCLKVYVNGVLTASGNTGYLPSSDTSNLVYIGENPNSGGVWFYNGYMSNIRVVKGTAAYTSNFAPPPSPLTAVTNTSLLTLQTNGGANNNGFIDNSPNNFLITRYGNTTQGSFDPFGSNWSNYFPANGNYLTGSNSIFNISATTVVWNFECWVYPISSGVFFAIGSGGTYGNSFYFDWGLGTANKFRFVQGSGGSNPVVITTSGTYTGNTWYHVAVSRTSAGVIKLFVNGTLDGTQTYNAGTLANGTTFVVNGSYDNNGLGNNGGNFYISNLRFLVGTALYTANFTVPTTPLTPITNTALLTCQSPSFQDNSPNNLAITLGSTPSVQRLSPFSNVLQTPQSYSTYIPSAITNYVSVPHSANLTITSGSTDSFIAECWVYFNTVTASTSILNQSGVNPSTFWNWLLAVDANKKFEISWGATGSPGSQIGVLSGTTVATAGVWYHLALVKTNADWSLFVNGTREATFNGLNTASDGTNNPLRIGSDNFSGQSITGYISNVRIYKGATANAPYLATNTTLTVPTSPLTAITNTQLLTCQNATLIDNSTNAFTLTAAGTPTPNQLNPFGYTTSQTQSYDPVVYGGSMYLDGTGDYLSTPASNFLTLGTNDHTVEFWYYLPSTSLASGYSTQWKYGSGSTQQATNDYYFQAGTAGGGGIGLTLGGGGSWAVSITGTIAQFNAMVGRWNHIAWTRASNVFKLFINGVQIGSSVTYSGSITAQAGPMLLGQDGSGNYSGGYFSNFRLLNGTAAYTSNFVPPLAPVTATTNTQLLLNGTSAGIYDSSMMNDLETVGNTQLAPQQPYAGSYYSNYFNGSNAYITVPNNDALNFPTGDFTIEMWIYPTAAGLFLNKDGAYAVAFPQYDFSITSGNKLQFQAGAGNQANTPSTAYTGTTNVTYNTWHHVAAVRTGTTIKVFLDGNQEVSTTQGVAMVSGDRTLDIAVNRASSLIYWSGSISNLRIVKGTAVYTANFTPSTTPLTAISGTSLLTCQSNKFIDNSTNNFTLTTAGTPTVQVFNPFANSSGQSIYFDGTGDYLPAPTNMGLSFGTGDFTIEGWFYTAVGTNNGIFQISDTAGGFKTNYTNTLAMSLSGGKLNTYGIAGTGQTSTGASYANSTWIYLTVVRSSGVTKIYANGILDTTFGTAGAIADTTNYTGTYIVVGGYYSTSYLWNGYIDDFRITKGIARYTTNFTPPTTPFLTK